MVELHQELEQFQSTPSVRRATAQFAGVYGVLAFQSTPSVRRATSLPQSTPPTAPISIHALREEGDLPVLILEVILNISIHALREEGDLPKLRPKLPFVHFNPRPP